MVIRGFIFFLILAAVSWVLMTQFNIPFGTVNFFDNHGFFFLIAITFFPRLTLLFSSVASGGVIWWISWLFFPRLLVATLATFAYFQTNPILVTISWLVAFGGESFEKRSISRSRVMIKHVPQGDVIDVDYKKMD